MLEKITYILYAIWMILFAGFFLFLWCEGKQELIQERGDSGYLMVSDYEKIQTEAEDAPAGVRTEYSFCISDVPKKMCSLLFYTVHQNVEVYVDNQLVYGMETEERQGVGKTPGNVWNCIPIYPTDTGKEVRIVITPVYESVVDLTPNFYFGSETEILFSVLKKDMPVFILSLIAILIGLVFICFNFYTYRFLEAGPGLLMMGFFTLFIGIWKMFDLEMMAILLPNSIAAAYVPYMALMMITVPFMMYLRSLLKNRDNVWWFVPGFAAFAVNTVSLVLQLTGQADCKQTLYLTHLVILFLVVVCVRGVYLEIKNCGITRRMGILLFCMGCSFVGMLVDMLVYYVTGGLRSTGLGMAAFLLYSLVLGILSIRDTKQLMAIGKKAKFYERMAYHDQLTGLYNRAAYVEDTEKEEFVKEEYIIVACDLNNLKKCNDTLGHDKGDNYIKKSAELIKSNFSGNAKWYRMGGDEFCVLLKHVSVQECLRRVENLKKEAEEYSNNHPSEYPICIACGYAVFDKENDYDFADTLRRADKMMYREKFQMKQKL